MTGSVHAAIGAALGRSVKSPVLAFALGVFSHFVGDVVPHHDMGATETPLVFATLARIGQQHGWKSAQFWGAIGGTIPDLEHIPAELRRDPHRMKPMAEKLFPTHNGTARHAGWPHAEIWGIAMQVALFLGGLWLAGSLGKKRSHDD